MKIVNIKRIKGCTSKVHDCEAGGGYLRTSHASFADVDNDFSADRIDEVKHYLEQRYDRPDQFRVFLAGALTTIKAKSAMKDVASVHKISRSTVNYLTQVIENDEITWTDLMKMACSDKRIAQFIQGHADVFEEMLPILGQGRSSTVHPSAVIVTPEFVRGERLNCYELLPVKKQNNMLVSELNGVEIDAIGILKNDILSVRELTRLSDIFDMIEREYGVRYTMLQIITKYLNEEQVFKVIQEGNTQGLFQFNGGGMTKFIKRLKPQNIGELIDAAALFRPGPLESGATDNYVRAKRGEYEPEYLWNTYDLLKDTYGQMVYQESCSQVAQRVGKLSLGDGVNLVKALSKKKIEKVRKFKDKFFKGAAENGCPKDVAEKIWNNIEDAAKYAFNKSHSASYGLTAYVGAWLKTHYPTAFYTVALRDQDEDKMVVLINEIKAVGGTEIEQPDINISDENFTADFKNNKIYWSLARIKQLGPKTVKYIVQERKLYGEFYNLEDFIKRIFKSKFKSFSDEGTEETRERCPVTACSVRNLIFSGAFDRCEHVGSVLERYGLLDKAAVLLGFKLSEKEVPEDMRDKHYFWSKQQIAISGYGSIDYRRIYDNLEKSKSLQSYKYIEFKDLNNMFYDVRRGVICATICSIADKSYKDRHTGENKHFGKIELQQNTETNILTIWDDWAILKKEFKNAVGHIIVVIVNVKWSDYDEKNTLQIGKSLFFKLI